MQWSPDRNAGFSHADPQRLYLAPIMDAIYGYQAINVEAQSRDPTSLLSWTKRMLAVRKTSQAFGRGTRTFLKPGNRKILAYLREYGEDTILCVANLCRSAQPVELSLGAYKGRVPIEMLGRTAFPPVGELPYLLTIAGYGFYWFQLSTQADVPAWHSEYLAIDERPVLVLFDGWSSLFRDRVVPWRIGMAEKTRNQFETDTLPRFIETQRWYAAKGNAIERAKLSDYVLWQEGKLAWMATLVDVAVGGDSSTYFVPLTLAWEEKEEERMRTLTPAAICKVRQQANVGIMADAFADEAFCRQIVAAIAADRDVATVHGAFKFRATSAFAHVAGEDFAALPVERPQGFSTNTVVTMGERLMLKGYRRLRAGISPELEMSCYLTEVAHFPNAVPVAGTVEYQGSDGKTLVLAMLQAYIANQGDGWGYSLDYLQRHLEQHRTTPRTDMLPLYAHDGYLALVRLLAQRTAELHIALAQRHGHADFDPQPITPADIDAWLKRAGEEATRAFALLEASLDKLPAAERDAGTALLAKRDAALATLRAYATAEGASSGVKTRIHGDYHLGQVLVTKNDFVIIDFEGEPGHSLEQRRARLSPLRDVAGMLRSFDYARHAALRNIARDEIEFAKLAPLADAWEKETRAAFITAYDEATRGAGLFDALTPDAGLLGLFELEKSFYELRYELGNRPAWADIPLRGILARLGE